MVTVAVELNADVVSLLEDSDRPVEREAERLIVTELYRRGDISRGKAAQVLGMPLEDFLRYAGTLGIPYVGYTEEEWEAEMRDVEAIAMSLQPSATPAR